MKPLIVSKCVTGLHKLSLLNMEGCPVTAACLDTLSGSDNEIEFIGFFNVCHILSRNYLVEAFPIVVIKPGQWTTYDNG